MPQNRLLLEILTEEIPHTLQKQLVADAKVLAQKALTDNLVTFGEIEVLATPRRLVIMVNDITEFTSVQTEEKKGPKIDTSAVAIEGFLRQNNLSAADLIQKNGFYFAALTSPKMLVKDTIASIIKNHILSALKFKKSMHWNASKVYWPRPIVSFLVILEANNTSDFIELEYAGVKSSNFTFGHRFLSQNNQPIVVSNITGYFKALSDNFVVLSQHERHQIIKDAAEKIAKQYNGNLLENWVLDELVYINEYPVVLQSTIPSKYLSLPKEMLVTIMANHQRYLNIVDTDNNLLPNFIIVANNNPTDNGAEIIRGNNKVLNARLADGLFFYNQDMKTPLEDNIEKLKSITWFEGLGSIYDKTVRMQNLFKTLTTTPTHTFTYYKVPTFTYVKEYTVEDIKNNNYITAQEINYITTQAIKFSKVDLASEVVKELPELQGIMGGHYYLHGKNPDKSSDIKQNKLVADAIAEHYKPINSTDSIPSTFIGAMVALVDKLDTLEQLFAAGKQPTSSTDPYALRRAALGIIKIITNETFYGIMVNRQLTGVDGTPLIFSSNKSLDTTEPMTFSNFTKNPELQKFLQERLKVYISDEYNISKEIVNIELLKVYELGLPTVIKFFSSYNNPTMQSINLMLARINNFTKSLSANWQTLINESLTRYTVEMLKTNHRELKKEAKDSKITTGLSEEDDNLFKQKLAFADSIDIDMIALRYEADLNAIEKRLNLLASSLEELFNKVKIIYIPTTSDNNHELKAFHNNCSLWRLVLLKKLEDDLNAFKIALNTV